MTNNRNSIKQRLAFQQYASGYKIGVVAVCFWCEKPGTDLDAHEWCIKRNANAPDEVTYQSWNMVLAHHECHITHGQTKEAKRKAYLFKKKFTPDIDWEITQAERALKQPIDKEFMEDKEL